MRLKRALSTLAFCAVGFHAHAEPLPQQDYDRQIQHYTQLIQKTKAILDEPDSAADADTQSQAFCDRLNAYQQIARLSQENLKLDLAPMMLKISQAYLEKQQQSLSSSGMTAGVFCAGKIKP